MDTLRKQVRRARRRLLAQGFLAALPWSCTIALALLVLLVAADKLWPLGLDLARGLAVALVAGMVIAAAWTVHAAASALSAALEVDRRFGLKERISTALALGPDELATPAGQAVLGDACRRIEQLDVAAEFRLGPDRRSWLPLVPGVLAVLLALFVPAVSDNTATATPDVEAKQQIKQSTAALEKKLLARKKEAEEQGLKQAEELFSTLQRETRKLNESDQADRQQALVRLNDLARELDKRREQLQSGAALKQQLDQLKKLMQGPADKLAEALRQGDFQQALAQLQELKQQLERSELNEQQREQLARQLAQMEQKLREIAEAHQNKLEQLQQQIAQKQAAGQQAEAEKLAQQLDKLKQQSPAMEQLQKMANDLGQCAKCLGEGQTQGAQEALESLEAQLGDLQQQMNEMAMIDEAMDEIGQCKNGMCAGAGNQPGNNPGQGLGRGRGQGPRPEEQGQTGFYDTRVKQQVGRGALIVTGQVEGPNAKGQVLEQIKTQMEAETAEAADPLTLQKLPRGYRDHVKEYSDALRQGRN